MPIKLTDDEIHDRATSRGFTLLSAYTNMNTPVIFSCGHGHTWKAKPAWVLSGAHGRGCPRCAGIGKLSQDVINERLEAAGVPIRMIGPYRTVVTKSLFRCEHGHEWSAKPADIVNSHKGCPKCFAARVRWTPEEINAELSARVLRCWANTEVPTTVLSFVALKGTSGEPFQQAFYRAQGARSALIAGSNRISLLIFTL